MLVGETRRGSVVAPQLAEGWQQGITGERHN